jgi:hypothetical protein
LLVPGEVASMLFVGRYFAYRDRANTPGDPVRPVDVTSWSELDLPGCATGRDCTFDLIYKSLRFGEVLPGGIYN